MSLDEAMAQYEDKTVEELRALCKERGIKKYSLLTKGALMGLLAKNETKGGEPAPKTVEETTSSKDGDTYEAVLDMFNTTVRRSDKKADGHTVFVTRAKAKHAAMEYLKRECLRLRKESKALREQRWVVRALEV